MTISSASAAADADPMLRPDELARLYSERGIMMTERQAKRLMAMPGFPRVMVLGRQYVSRSAALAYLSPSRGRAA